MGGVFNGATNSVFGPAVPSEKFGRELGVQVTTWEGSAGQGVAPRGASAATPQTTHAPWRALELLARRLSRSARRVAALWVATCEGCGGLCAENPEYLQALRRIAEPLITALGGGRREVAELHAIELFNDLSALDFDTSATLQVIECLACASSNILPDEQYESGCRELARFLTCVAVEVAARPAAPCAWVESSERPRVSLSSRLPELVGESAALSALRQQLVDVAEASGAVLITGESGTGKELVAQALHRLSGNGSRPHLAVNCSALPRELVESELFGHERGAFTGSRESAPGLLRAAADGTVFLDEITEMPLALQPKLLRALEQRAVRPVGGLRELPVHARIIAATNRDPEQALRSGQLRADLFYRLCVHRIDVPSLRERVEDVPALAIHFLRGIALRGQSTPRAFSRESLAQLQSYHWPGNIRELRNVVEQCCARARGAPIIEGSHLPRALATPPTVARSGEFPHAQVFAGGEFEAPRVVHVAASQALSNAPATANDVPLLPLHQVEREHIERALRACGGNKTHAAQMLGLSRHQLYLRLERLGLNFVGEKSSRQVR